MEAWLPPARLATYLTAAGGDRPLALEFYEWNTAVSATVLHDLAHLEVAVRNAYDAAWIAGTSTRTEHWTGEPGRYFPPVARRARNGVVVDANRTPRDQIASAVRAAGRGAPAGKVVAELSFFWRYLPISARERDLWLPYLRHAFVAGTSRKTIDVPMARLHLLRNRVAHHEPLLDADLEARYADVLAVLGRIDSRIAAHVETHSTWIETVSQRPHASRSVQTRDGRRPKP